MIVVFDRDDHETYHQALAKVSALNKALVNDEKRHITVDAIVSVPCFELWFLLHFEDVHAPIHRDEVLRRLRQHLRDYEKGRGGHWPATRDHLEIATARAEARAAATTGRDGQQPYTDMHKLIELLVHLKD